MGFDKREALPRHGVLWARCAETAAQRNNRCRLGLGEEGAAKAVCDCLGSVACAELAE
jgi:hypothetical protein